MDTSLTLETALTLTVHQLQMLQEARTRVLAAQGISRVDDTKAAIDGSFGEEGFRSMQTHIERLQAISQGRDPEEASSYTEGAVL